MKCGARDSAGNVLGFFAALITVGALILVFPPLGILVAVALAFLSGQGS